MEREGMLADAADAVHEERVWKSLPRTRERRQGRLLPRQGSGPGKPGVTATSSSTAIN